MGITIRGTDLRHWVIGELRRQSTMSIPELIAAAEAQGLSFSGRPSKAISDALRWERRRSRVIRTGRGQYTLGVIPRTSGQHIDHRLSALTAAVERHAK
ncbi:hypothetical protein GOHSU_54_00170 [Gordonia hirsuta DSM 44140 = NBRC 16056]|uniref:HTH HARE-type domain-containing protein n=1 Tax=Gordonia hirsuta DSM 44140 = NBRC 16056 TaxID=1121927 RepID=L7LD40_9ACTN|nr:hypothetical protein [Gordonia hirsuta]GAC58839.1 hypothetical protein GOHSU_54_00170 [Gordonia hirsuta DSM 44140 = NBRC 16056]